MPWRHERAFLAFAVGLACALASSRARALPPDSTYGRIDGDLQLSFGTGLAIAPRNVRVAVDARVRYLETVGVFATYEEGSFSKSADPDRALVGGIELRPLFLARWLQGAESGRGRFDLFVDSFGLELGLVMNQPPQGAFGSSRAIHAGLGLEFPILARATGLWVGVHGGFRWSDEVMEGKPVGGPSDRSVVVAITLAWHQVVGSPVVDLWDARP